MILENSIEKCKELITSADAVLIGAGAGLSTAAGLEYGGQRFTDNFSDYMQRYNLTDMYSSVFYPWPTLEEKWAYLSRHIKLNRYDFEVPKLYTDLLNFVKNKNHFVLTTNGDSLFERAGFDTQKIFAMQGDYTKFQCEKACHNTLYDNKEIVFKMVDQQANFKIPSDLLQICPRCGENMVPNLRMDSFFVEDEDWHIGSTQYSDFLKENATKSIVLLELGVGYNTPSIIRWPFEQFAIEFSQTTLIRVNMDNVDPRYSIPDDSLLIKDDIAEFIQQVCNS